MTEYQKQLASGFFKAGMIKFGSFKLKLHETRPESPLSPIYVNLRALISFPDLIDLVIDGFVELIKKEKISCDLLADLPTAATPITSLLMHKTRIPMISFRKEQKNHGIPAQIEGVFTGGQTALLVDDLVTLADSKFEASKVLSAQEIIVRDILVVVDREQGAGDVLEAAGFTLHSLLTLSGVMSFYLEEGFIDRETHEKVTVYLKSIF